MKYRIRKYLDITFDHKLSIGNMFIGTIHGFCFELLKQHLAQYQLFDPLDDNRCNIFLKRHYWDLKLNELKDKGFGGDWENYQWQMIFSFIKSVNIVREERINLEDIKNEKFIQSFKAYEELLDKNRKMDFSSMLSKAVDMLKTRSEIYDKIRQQYKYIIVDEYQDINNIQEELIRLIVGDSNNICVVGDDDQSIYHWRGADVTNILTFMKRNKNIHTVNLDINFRGTDGIVAIANSLIRNNLDRLKKSMNSKQNYEKGDIKQKYEKGDIYYVNFSNQEEEIDFIINKIKNLRGTSFIEKDGTERAINWYDFALLFRSVRNYARPYINALRKEGIPFIVKGSIGLFEHPEINLIIDTMKFLFDYSRSINLDYFKNPTQADKLFYLLENIKDNDKINILNQFLDHLKTIHKTIQIKRKINFQNLFQEIISGILMGKYRFKEEIYYNLGQLSRIISDFEGEFYPIQIKQVQNFFNFIKYYASSAYEEQSLEERFGNSNAVQIMTMHRAKGLEYPVIFIPAMVKRAFPKEGFHNRDYLIDESLFQAARYDTTEESQRRLLYVAITRSMKYLFIISSQKMQKAQQNSASDFLNELDSNFMIIENLPDPTNRIKSLNFLPPKVSYFPTSFSELGYFFDCPKDYQIRFIFGFNPKIVEALGYGRSIHNIINIIYKQAKRREFDISNVLQLVEDNFYLPFAPKDAFESMKKGAYNIIEKYVTKYPEELKLALETEKPFELLLGNTLISGKIDLIRKKKQIGEELIIVDFKTEKDPDFLRQKKHEDQVILYGFALESLYGNLPSNVFIHYLDEGARKEAFFTRETINTLKEEIIQTVNNIRNNKFSKSPKDSSRCEKCDFSLICS